MEIDIWKMRWRMHREVRMRNILYGYVFTYVCMWVRYPGWNLLNQLHLNVIEFVTLRVSRLGYVWSETWCAVPCGFKMDGRLCEGNAEFIESKL